MLNITYGNSTTFSIQSTLSYFANGYPIYQRLLVGGAQDCSTAFQDPNQVLSKPYTFQNFALLLVLAPNNFTDFFPFVSLDYESMGNSDQFKINTTDTGLQNITIRPA